MCGMLTSRISLQLACGACLTGMLAGCSSSPNDRLAVGDAALPAFMPDDDRGPTDDVASNGILDRSGWEPVTLVVPVDSTHHQPHYRTPPIYAGRVRTARQTGSYPDTDSSLQTEGDVGARVAEGCAAPLQAAGEILLFPFAAIFTAPPWAASVSPTLSYERVRREAPDNAGEAH